MRGYLFDAVFVDKCSESLSRNHTYKAAGIAGLEAHRAVDRGGSEMKNRERIKRDRGMRLGMAHYPSCGWKGQLHATAAQAAGMKRPFVKCQCGQGLFWSKLTKAQADLLAP